MTSWGTIRIRARTAPAAISASPATTIRSASATFRSSGFDGPALAAVQSEVCPHPYPSHEPRRTSNIEHRTPNAERRTSNAEHRMAARILAYSAFEVGRSTFDVLLRFMGRSEGERFISLNGSLGKTDAALFAVTSERLPDSSPVQTLKRA